MANQIIPGSVTQLNSIESWRVRGGKLQLPAEQIQMAASCHHKAGKRSMLACGGCYARMHEALAQIRKAATIEDAHAIVEAVIGAMKADAEHPPATPSP